MLSFIFILLFVFENVCKNFQWRFKNLHFWDHQRLVSLMVTICSIVCLVSCYLEHSIPEWILYLLNIIGKLLSNVSILHFNRILQTILSKNYCGAVYKFNKLFVYLFLFSTCIYNFKKIWFMLNSITSVICEKNHVVFNTHLRFDHHVSNFS